MNIKFSKILFKKTSPNVTIADETKPVDIYSESRNHTNENRFVHALCKLYYDSRKQENVRGLVTVSHTKLLQCELLESAS